MKKFSNEQISVLEQNKKNRIAQGELDISRMAKKLKNFSNRNLSTTHINYKIHHLLHDPFTFVNAYAKISKNRGALTKGIKSDSEIMNYFGLSNAKNISEKFKNNTYFWSPTRRVWIPKPANKKKCPISTPTQEDQIVQEAVRGILESIYEPEFREFEKENDFIATNYGFRPNKSCIQALQTLQLQGQTSNYVIEGDIIGAYNNVNHDILLNILSKRIKDKKFISVISSMLKAGIMDQKQYEHTLTGTPQGGIISPILFNIYMFEFDKFVYNGIIKPLIDSYSGIKKRSPLYQKLKSDLDKYLKLWKNSPNNSIESKKYKVLFLETRKKKMVTPSYDINTLQKKAVYTRYADDWVILFTGSESTSIEYKNLMKNFLESQLKLKLDPEKTITSKLTKGFQFLGYSLIMWSTDQIKVARTLSKNKFGIIRAFRRTTSRKLSLRPDKERLLKNLTLGGFCDSNQYPIGVRPWSNFDEYDIVLKYRQIMIGIHNYYRNCDSYYILNRVNYILKYSCAKTIATRKKITMSQTFKEYGSELKIEKQIYSSNSVYSKFVTFPDLKTLNIEPPIPINPSGQEIDPFKIK